MDREKVIADLKAYRDRDFIREGKTVFDNDPRYRKKIINNAIALLKEQDAVVHPEPSCEMTYITDCCCDLCGVQLIREDNFCRCCGKRIEWEGR